MSINKFISRWAHYSIKFRFTNNIAICSRVNLHSCRYFIYSARNVNRFSVQYFFIINVKNLQIFILSTSKHSNSSLFSMKLTLVFCLHALAKWFIFLHKRHFFPYAGHFLGWCDTRHLEQNVFCNCCRHLFYSWTSLQLCPLKYSVDFCFCLFHNVLPFSKRFLKCKLLWSRCASSSSFCLIISSLICRCNWSRNTTSGLTNSHVVIRERRAVVNWSRFSSDRCFLPRNICFS